MSEIDKEKELKKWNWGAFQLSFIWGIFNKTYITLLIVPIVILQIIFFKTPDISSFFKYVLFVFSIICGKKGTRWAWESGKFSDFEDFLEYQRKWNKIGLIVFKVVIVFLTLAIIILFCIYDQPTQCIISTN